MVVAYPWHRRHRHHIVVSHCRLDSTLRLSAMQQPWRPPHCCCTAAAVAVAHDGHYKHYYWCSDHCRLRCRHCGHSMFPTLFVLAVAHAMAMERQQPPHHIILSICHYFYWHLKLVVLEAMNKCASQSIVAAAMAATRVVHIFCGANEILMNGSMQTFWLVSSFACAASHIYKLNWLCSRLRCCDNRCQFVMFWFVRVCNVKRREERKKINFRIWYDIMWRLAITITRIIDGCSTIYIEVSSVQWLKSCGSFRFVS